MELSGTEVTTISTEYPGLTGAFARVDRGADPVHCCRSHRTFFWGEEGGDWPPASPRHDVTINWADFPGTATITLANSHSGNYLSFGDVTITNAPDMGVFNFQDVQSAGDFSIIGIGGIGNTDTINYGTGYLSTDPVGGGQTFTSQGIDNLNVNVFGEQRPHRPPDDDVYTGGILVVANPGNTGHEVVNDHQQRRSRSCRYWAVVRALSQDTLTLLGGTLNLLPGHHDWSETGTLNLNGTAEYWLGVTNASTINDNVGTESLIMNAPGDAIDISHRRQPHRH